MNVYELFCSTSLLFIVCVLAWHVYRIERDLRYQIRYLMKWRQLTDRQIDLLLEIAKNPATSEEARGEDDQVP